MSELALILFRDTDGKLKFWACRGEGKGCKRNQFRSKKSPCEDCVPAHNEDETLEQLQKRMTRGDA